MSEVWTDAIVFFDTPKTAAIWADVFGKVKNGEIEGVIDSLKKLGLNNVYEEIERGFQIPSIYQSQRRVTLSFSEGITHTEDILKNFTKIGATHIKATIDNSQTGTQATICKIGNRKAKVSKFIESVSEFDDEYAFIQAIMKGKATEVENLLSKGVSPNVEIAPDWYPIHLAVFNNKKAIVSLLIDAGANLNVQTTNDPELSAYQRMRTPLHIAVENNYKNIVNLLLKAGADHSMKNGKGETPLHDAIGEQEKDICKLLIKAGANQNENTSRGEPAFFNLSSRKEEKLIDFLLFLESMGADITSSNEAGANLLWIYGHLPEIRELFSEKNISLKRPQSAYCGDHRNNLIEAIKHYDIEKIEEFLCMKSDINEPIKNESDYFEDTPIVTAVRKKSIDIVELLLAAGADPNSMNGDALKWAARHNSKEIALLLIENGADIYAKEDDEKEFGVTKIGRDVMLHALECEAIDVALLLLEKGWVREKKAIDMALCYAAMVPNAEKVISHLLKLGANPNEIAYNRTNAYCDAVMCATRESHLSNLEVLVKQGADVNLYSKFPGKPAPIHAAAEKKNNGTIIKCLIEAGANVNLERGDKKSTPILTAAHVGCVENANILYENGAEIMVNGRTTTIYKRAKSNKKFIEWLDTIVKSK